MMNTLCEFGLSFVGRVRIGETISKYTCRLMNYFITCIATATCGE